MIVNQILAFKKVADIVCIPTHINSSISIEGCPNNMHGPCYCLLQNLNNAGILDAVVAGKEIQFRSEPKNVWFDFKPENILSFWQKSSSSLNFRIKPEQIKVPLTPEEAVKYLGYQIIPHNMTCAYKITGIHEKYVSCRNELGCELKIGYESLMFIQLLNTTGTEKLYKLKDPS